MLNAQLVGRERAYRTVHNAPSVTNTQERGARALVIIAEGAPKIQSKKPIQGTARRFRQYRE